MGLTEKVRINRYINVVLTTTEKSVQYSARGTQRPRCDGVTCQTPQKQQEKPFPGEKRR